MRAAFLIALLFCAYLAPAQLGDIIKRTSGALNQHSTAGLSNDKIIAGLKEALRISTSNAVAVTGSQMAF